MTGYFQENDIPENDVPDADTDIRAGDADASDTWIIEEDDVSADSTNEPRHHALGGMLYGRSRFCMGQGGSPSCIGSAGALTAGPDGH